MDTLELQRRAYMRGFNDALHIKWTKCSDRMPDTDGRYLVAEDHHGVWIGVASMRKGAFDMSITHWMPLPDAPHDG